MKKSYNYIELIQRNETDKTQKIIGKINCDVLKQASMDSLLYIFPLIERIVLAIYRLIPQSNVEQYERDVPRTLNAILKENETLKVLSPKVKNVLKKYFENDGLRNKVFHNYYEIKDNKIDLSDLIKSMPPLLKTLNKKIEAFEKVKTKKIQYLK